MPSNVHLHQAASFEACWEGVVGPWLREASSTAWTSKAPFVVLAPTRVAHQALKARLLREGVPLAALRFWTTSDARRFLLGQTTDHPAIPVREHLHLALAMLAHQQKGVPTCRSIARDPSRLLRTLDLLAAAGADTSALNVDEARRLADQLTDLLPAHAWRTVQATDWELASRPPHGVLGQLLVWGFNAAHMAQWPILLATVHASQRADIVLAPPRFKGEALEQAWIGTWEQAFGSAEPVDADDASGPFRALVERMETPGLAAAADEPDGTVLIGRNLAAEATAVAARVAGLVASGGHGAIGVLFDGPGPLSREVSARLSSAGIEHFDGLGHKAQATGDADRLRRWLAHQRAPSLASLRALLDCAAAGDEEVRAFERLTTDAFHQVLSDDPAVLRAWITQRRDAGTEPALQVFDRFAGLPPEAAVRDFLHATTGQWRTLGWTDLADTLAAQAAKVEPLHASVLTRTMVLDWIEASCADTELSRAERGRNPLARVQLLPYSVAEDLSWEHLVMTGMNDGCWPPRVEPPAFLSEAAIADLNRTALAEGNQGAGHVTMKPGRTLLLGPAEQRTIARRQFYNLVEHVTGSITLTASLEGDGAEGRVLPASDLLSHLYFVQHGEALNDQRMQRLEKATAAWIADGAPATAGGGEIPAGPSIEATRIAYDARRREEPFGPYDFARATPPIEPLTLPCKAWQGAVSDPAGTFLQRVLDVAPADAPEEEDRSAVARGIWIHGWLKDAVVERDPERMRRRRGRDDMMKVLDLACAKTVRDVESAYRSAGRQLPDWWTSLFQQSLALAESIARQLAAVDTWPYAATEWRLPKPLALPVRDGRTLRLSGQIDLVLSSHSTLQADGSAWVVDFKTGGDKELKSYRLAKDLANGEGIQIALYALALHALGAGHVYATLLTPKSAAKPQVALADLTALDSFWTALARMQDTAVFGMRGELRPEYGAPPTLPIATLPVLPDLLELRWQLTHPDLCASTEDET